jgi:glycosyltransferase involved in cell wall biosynthesis
MKTTIILPALNEAERVGFVMDQVARSESTSAILVVDGGSIDNTVEVVKRKGNEIKKPCRVIRSEYRHCGKGVAMITGMKSAIKSDTDTLCFFDSDIESITPEWVDRLVAGIADGADECRGTFDRARDDALITKHITRPLISLFFPELSHIRQPLGGELALSKKIAEELITRPRLVPTHSWGIDTWILLNSSLLGGRIKEINLGEKIHKPKEISGLKGMLIQCFRELVEIADLEKRFKYSESKFRLEERAETRSRVREIRVMKNLDESIKSALEGWSEEDKKMIRELPYSSELISLIHSDEFKSEVKGFTSEKWIRILCSLAKKCVGEGDVYYRERVLNVLFKLWSMYSAGYVLYHTDTFDEAEEYVDKQCKTAFDLRRELLG